MSRIQLALNVPDIDQAVDFYSRLFSTPPTKRRPGYANFAVADPPLKLVLLESNGAATRLNHLGVETDGSDEFRGRVDHLDAVGIDSTDGSGTCCFADQAKVWVEAPDGQWEFYTVLGDSPTFGGEPGTMSDQPSEQACCAPAPPTPTACCA